jgi:hypothetical protein
MPTANADTLGLLRVSCQGDCLEAEDSGPCPCSASPLNATVRKAGRGGDTNREPKEIEVIGRNLSFQDKGHAELLTEDYLIQNNPSFESLRISDPAVLEESDKKTQPVQRGG